MAYFKETLKGLSWMTALRVVIRLLAVVKTAILARVLMPQQFGVYGVALLVLGLLETLTETGINVFLIQQKEEIKSYLNSAWVVSIVRGFMIAVLVLLSSPFVVQFFGVPQVQNLLYIVAAVAFVRGFINPMVVSFQKQLQFQKEFLFQSVLFLIDAGIAIGLGYATKSESAFLYAMLTAALVEVFLSFVIFKHKPKLSLDLNKVKEVVNAGKWVTGAGVFSYIFQNIDNLIVGKLLGAAQLGFYQQAYRISTLPVSEAGQIFNKVTFPIFVKMSDDKKRLSSAYLKTFSVAFVLVLLFGILISMFSHQIVLLVLGPNWISVENVLKVLAIYGVFKSLLNSTYSLFLSQKMQRVVMFSELAGIIGIGVFIYPLTIKLGILGTAYSVVFGSLLSLPIIFYNYPKIFKNNQ